MTIWILGELSKFIGKGIWREKFNYLKENITINWRTTHNKLLGGKNDNWLFEKIIYLLHGMKIDNQLLGKKTKQNKFATWKEKNLAFGRRKKYIDSKTKSMIHNINFHTQC